MPDAATCQLGLPGLPPQPWLMSAALLVPWLLRWQAVLSLVWAATLLAQHRELVPAAP